MNFPYFYYLLLLLLVHLDCNHVEEIVSVCNDDHHDDDWMNGFYYYFVESHSLKNLSYVLPSINIALYLLEKQQILVLLFSFFTICNCYFVFYSLCFFLIKYGSVFLEMHGLVELRLVKVFSQKILKSHQLSSPLSLLFRVYRN